MNLLEALRTGCVEICSHKMRSFLSFLAIAFGVAAILYTFAQVNRMVERRKEAFDLVGSGRMEIKAKRGYESQGLSRGLTASDADAIRSGVPGLHMVSPVARQWGTRFLYEDFHEKSMLAWGVTSHWRKRDWVYRVRGRFLDRHDVRTYARVCVIDVPGGWHEKPFWAHFFPESKFHKFVKHNDLVGKTVRLGDHLFEVVGMLHNPPRDKDPRWFQGGYGGEGTVYVPLTTYQRFLVSRGGWREGNAWDSVDEIQVDTGDERTVPLTKRLIEKLLKARHRGETDYEIKDFRETIQGILNRTRQYAIAVLAIGLVAILAGGIGIMNVTMATIYSRIREIGVRRAIGATRSDILLQFVTEAILLGALGGVAGIGLGLTGINYLDPQEGTEIIAALEWWHFLATLGIAAGAGLIFSAFPAYQASRLDPVQALRYE
ncbi:MAG: ABC transporter permease [Elusimicrobiota bacterium]